MRERIRLTIKPGGVTETEVKGVKGKGCKDLTKELEQEGDVLSDRITAEFHEQPTVTTKPTLTI